jgi:hypothetical protein
MARHSLPRHTLVVALLTIAAILACRDVTHATGPHAPSTLAERRHRGLVIPFVMRCTGHRQKRTVSCKQQVIMGAARSPILRPVKAASSASRLRKDQIVGGGQGTYITFGTANYAFDTISNIFSFDATVQNNLRQPLGTPDGTTVSGVRIFVLDLYATSGTGAVNVTNADSTGTFTAPNQPYFIYNQLLTPGQTSTSRNWQIYIAPTVDGFYFDIEAYASFPAEYSVPAVAPSSVSDSVYASANVTPSDTLIGLPFLNNLVMVAFDSTAAQGDRALAVAKAGGSVVGGIGVGGLDGFYYVQIPGDAAGDSVMARIATFDSLPQVSIAGPEVGFQNGNDYLRPYDGPKARIWHVDPNDQTYYGDSTWAQERIALPLAWGCSTGSPNVRIAVLDAADGQGYIDLEDLHANVNDSNPAPFYGFAGTGLGAHGTAVASIIGAVGDNGIGISGVMWDASLALYKRGLTTEQDWWMKDIILIGKAINSNSRVINLSGNSGFSKADTSNILTRHLSALFQAYLFYEMKIFIKGGKDPLLVFAAGNSSREAQWNGYPVLVDSFPERVLVAEATTRASNDQRASYSNFGVWVNIAAPGGDTALGINDGVLALDEEGDAVYAAAGTSSSAPLVTGVAGLLFAFDSTLTASQVKELIINGAIAGGRTSTDGTPLLNAYQSLHLAAQRTGAPLCGNLTLKDFSFNVQVVRHDSTTETIYAGDSDSFVFDQHGGHRINFQSSSLSYSTSGWHFNANDTSWYALTGQYISGINMALGKNHDGDTTLLMGTDTLYAYDTSLTNLYWQTPLLPAPPAFHGVQIAYGTHTVYVAFYYDDVSCPPCEDTDLWAISLSTLNATRLLTMSGAFTEVGSMRLSEDGSTLALVYNTLDPCGCQYDFHMNVYNTSPFALQWSRDNVEPAFAPERVVHRLPHPTVAASRLRQSSRGSPHVFKH